MALDAYIYEALRLPRARVRRSGGTLADLPPYEMLGQLLGELGGRSVLTEVVDDVIVGTSTPAGEQATDVARAAAQWAGWPDNVPGGVVSRLCCSGLDALEAAAARVASGLADVVVAGGVESMSRVPMFRDDPALLTDEELGERTGFVTIGVSADVTAVQYGFAREDLDAYAVESHRRAAQAPHSEAILAARCGDSVVLEADEGARPDVTVEQLAALPALFGEDPSWERVLRRLPEAVRPSVGLHTIATAPQLADGAAAAIVGNASAAAKLGLEPIGQVLASAQSAVRSPLLTASVTSAQEALRRAGLSAPDVDVAMVNESFAVTPLLVQRELGLDPDRVNPHGGALAVGHPLGATGGILLADALAELRRVDGEVALLCIPAALGLGAAMVVRRLR
ncbi:thiolase family protein [Intrasporangium sp.]|uniref:thiolase family protein n=1 Tax=Intrasporangium sp. TaxID=1925024 RepID=UPI00293B672E|nr:thiolase family protein [Intrasporangium sp.]MDV3220454.1 thiolase family protein [Intrasporangium sp.]